MIKAPQFSPLLLLLVLRAAHTVAQETRMPTAEVGRAWPGLRGVLDQSDKPLWQWVEQWPVSAKESLAQAWADPMLQQALLAPRTEEALPPPLGVLWTPAPQGLSASAVDALLVRQAEHQPLWLTLPADPTVWQQWSKAAFDTSVRLGVAWQWQAPPAGSVHWEAYIQQLARHTPLWMETPHANQWVHPWAGLMQQILTDALRQGQPQARATPPEGEARGDWGKAKRAVAQAWQQHWGGPVPAQEILVGLLVYAVHHGWTS